MNFQNADKIRFFERQISNFITDVRGSSMLQVQYWYRTIILDRSTTCVFFQKMTSR